MNKRNLFTLASYLFVGYFLLVIGCKTLHSPNLKMPKALPPIIRTYKHVVLEGGTAVMKNTGVNLKKGDTFTILATGSINRCPGKKCKHQIVKPEDGFRYGLPAVFARKPGFYNCVSILINHIYGQRSPVN